MSDHPTRELLPGYSLGCLEEAEEREVRAHVAVCPACRDELTALQEVTGSLALALSPAVPPAGLEARIRERVEGEARAPRAGRVRGRPGVLSFRMRALGAVAAVLIVALGAGNILQLKGSAARGPQGDASLTTAMLRGTTGQLDAYGTIVLDPEDNHGVLAVRGLHRLDAGHQYQLWLIKGTERRSGGVFSVNTDGYGALMLDVPPDFKGFSAMGISVEPTGGSPAPTGTAVMRGTI